MSSPATEQERNAADRLIGEVLANRYQIEERLGEGAMGSVYKAKHVKVGRTFAVKVLHKRLLEDKKVTQRFEREAELAGRLRHPNVVGVVDVGETGDGFRYMVMDFAEGDDLATLLAEAPMPAERITHLTRQLLEGLYHAHEAGLIHRDFKPENVIVERDDHDTEVPRIVDFGIAILREGGDNVSSAGRLTTNGLVLGTPHYMAPEQAVADPIDHRIDLFALGIVIYEMLCGKLPFDGTGAEVARANLLLDPPPIASRVPYLEIDPLLEAFARRLMAKKREHRPATAKAARELLDLITSDRVAAATALGVPLGSSSRTPAVTQPVTPQRATTETGEHTPGEPVPVSAKSSPSIQSIQSLTRGLEGPPVQSIVLAPARNESHVTTDRSEPLGWNAGSRRRTWIIAGISAFSVAALATVIVIKSTAGGDAAPIEEPAKVVLRPEPAAPPPPEPVKQQQPPEPVKQPAIAVEPVAPPPPVKKVQPPAKKIVVVKKPDPPPEVKKPDPPPVVVVPEVKKDVVSPANALAALYTVVGQEIKAAAQVSGASAVAAIDQRYRNINIQTAYSSPKVIESTTAMLNGMRAQLAPLKKKP